MSAFDGFPPETIGFLHELRANNHKNWFDAHRADYEQWWIAPAKAFVVAAGEVLAELAPGIRAEPRVLGAILATCERHWRPLAPLHRWLTANVQDA